MKTSSVFYLCPTCFYASQTPDDSHEHTLLRVDPGLPGDARRKPVTDRDGLILSAAPFWFHEVLLRSRIVSGSASGTQNISQV